MKSKSILCALALIAAPAFVSAQKMLPFSIDLGPKIGVNFNTLNGNSWNGQYKTNLLGGIFAGIHGKRVGVVAEGLFSQSRYTVGKDFHTLYEKYYNDISDSLKEGSFRVNYLSVPLLAQVKLFPMIWLQLGPQFSTIVSVKDVDGLLDDAAGIFKSGHISGIGGLEAKLPFGLRISGRYVFGLTNANNTTVADTWKQRSVQIAVGYSFL